MLSPVHNLFEAQISRSHLNNALTFKKILKQLGIVQGKSISKNWSKEGAFFGSHHKSH